MLASFFGWYKPGRRLNYAHGFYFGQCHDCMIGGTFYNYSGITIPNISFIGKKVHVKRVDTFSSIGGGKNGINSNQPPTISSHYANEMERDKTIKEQRTNKPDYSRPSDVNENNVKKSHKGDRKNNCEISKQSEISRRGQDRKKILFLFAILIFACTIITYLLHSGLISKIIHSATFLDVVGLALLWEAALLVWHSSAHLSVELNLFPKISKMFFSWLLMPICLWPLVLMAYLGYWHIFFGLIIYQIIRLYISFWAFEYPFD